LIAAAIVDGQALHFDVGDVSVHDIESDAPTIRYRQSGELRVLQCDVVAGCDGFHGICRPSIPAAAIHSFTRTYPFAWLGILSASTPASAELVYARHERGFALQSMRSPEVTRHIQVPPDDTIES
jgi:p-hydroxybenzoate 3-monooxygenase